jgi:hypothetical protein
MFLNPRPPGDDLAPDPSLPSIPRSASAKPTPVQSLTYMVKERHPHLVSQVRTAAVGRGMKLAVTLHL